MRVSTVGRHISLCTSQCNPGEDLFLFFTAKFCRAQPSSCWCQKCSPVDSEKSEETLLFFEGCECEHWRGTKITNLNYVSEELNYEFCVRGTKLHT